MTGAATPPAEVPDDAPLRHDIRFLGVILGDVIREQAGARVFGVVEGAGRLAVEARRSRGRAAALAAHLDHLSDGDALIVIRASSLFTLLANIAEDVHHGGRRDGARAAAPPGTLRGAVARLDAAGFGADEVAAVLGVGR